MAVQSSKFRTLLGVSLVLFLIGLALGYIPEHRRISHVQADLAQARNDAQTANAQLGSAYLNERLALAYLEVSEKNFGAGSKYASQFFDKAQQMQAYTDNVGLKQNLDESLKLRDNIMATIGRSDPAAEGQLASIWKKLVGLKE